MSDATIVVTNDDGIESPGLQRLVEQLSSVGEVTAVAPATNQSAVGRSIEATAEFEEHRLGYAVHGSPATCVLAASALDLEPDIVVSGINKGANLGAPMLGRSGTVGAAVEAAYLGYPSMAISTYIPFERIQGDFTEYSPEPAQYDPAATVATRLTEGILENGIPSAVDYLNVNAPLRGELQAPRVHMTAPADGYYTISERNGDQVILQDQQFELLHTGELATEGDTDRAVLSKGHISVTPMRLAEQVLLPSERVEIGQRLLGEVPWRLPEFEQ